MNRPTAVKVLLVQKETILRQGMKALLSGTDEFAVVAEAATIAEGVRSAVELGPEVVIAEMDVPQPNGIVAAEMIREKVPGIGLIILTRSQSPADAISAFRAGARGYLSTESRFEELRAAILAVAAGSTYIGSSFTDLLMPGTTPCRVPGNSPRTLSKRELEVLGLIAEGRNTKEIASALFLSSRTVESHRMRIMNKLEIRSVAGLTKYALREGLISMWR